jgi:FkbM family methyltransferase
MSEAKSFREVTATKLPDGLEAYVRPDFFFVNVGANDGVSNDPIYPFIVTYGWRGIAVEPNERMFARLKQNLGRFPGVVFENAAVAERSGTRDFYLVEDDVPESLSWVHQNGSLHEGYLRKTIGLMRTYEFRGPVPADLESKIRKSTVPCLSFDDLMRKHGAERVDFLNVDTEGNDYQLIRTIDLERWRPSVIFFEDTTMTPEELRETEQRLHGLGYSLLDKYDIFSVAYVRK